MYQVDGLAPDAQVPPAHPCARPAAQQIGPLLTELLNASARMHRHLCPRQVLGVRMRLLAGAILDIDVPQQDKRLLTIVETDGCAADGIAVATNCWIGRRTLRIEDYGKVAATFVDSITQQAIRIVPRSDVRQHAAALMAHERGAWRQQLLGYQRLPDEVLLLVQPVALTTPLDVILSRAGKKVVCAGCQEEIINGRELVCDGRVLCRACARPAYYRAPGSHAPGFCETTGGDRG